MPEIMVATRPNITMKMKNFQMVFHHWPNEIFATARPATVMPATGLIVLMVWLANCRAVTAASG